MKGISESVREEREEREDPSAYADGRPKGVQKNTIHRVPSKERNEGKLNTLKEEEYAVGFDQIERELLAITPQLSDK